MNNPEHESQMINITVKYSPASVQHYSLSKINRLIDSTLLSAHKSKNPHQQSSQSFIINIITEQRQMNTNNHNDHKNNN